MSNVRIVGKPVKLDKEDQLHSYHLNSMVQDIRRNRNLKAISKQLKANKPPKHTKSLIRDSTKISITPKEALFIMGLLVIGAILVSNYYLP